MNHEGTGGGRPGAQEIRAALERVVASDVMRSSPQLTAFLRFVVEAVLEGNSDRIKGYVIAVEVLKRGASFNPQIDPIVRVEATRLRRTLERYYGGAGAGDPVVETLPRGNGLPFLLVQPFEVSGRPEQRSLSAQSLHARLSDAFAHFDLVNIVWGSTSGARPARATADLRVDYRLA